MLVVDVDQHFREGEKVVDVLIRGRLVRFVPRVDGLEKGLVFKKQLGEVG